MFGRDGRTACAGQGQEIHPVQALCEEDTRLRVQDGDQGAQIVRVGISIHVYMSGFDFVRRTNVHATGGAEGG